MKAKINKVYAQIVEGKVQWIFTSKELPEWNENDFTGIEIPIGTTVSIGDSYEEGVFTRKVDDTIAELSRIMRIKRDEVLTASDWSQLADVPEDLRRKWQKYRQALRDVPQQATFPNQIVWPMIPSASNQTEEEILADFVTKIQSSLDAFARTRNYDGILSACTYISSRVPNFASDARICIDLRDATWAAAYRILGDVKAGRRNIPTSLSELSSELPPLIWV
jgi:hypothetical protein